MYLSSVLICSVAVALLLSVSVVLKNVCCLVCCCMLDSLKCVWVLCLVADRSTACPSSEELDNGRVLTGA